MASPLRRPVRCFFDPLLRVEDATAGGEQRDAVIGLTENWALLFVVHMLREGDAIQHLRPARHDPGKESV
jgi:uncharacterized DUF497 family protein